MAKVNLTQGAKLAGVSRSTLNRHIKEGRVSKVFEADGKPCVDTSELQRVYGELSHGTSSQVVPIEQHRAPSNTHEKDIKIATLEAELNAANKRLEEVCEDRDEWRVQAKSLLSDQRASARPAKERAGRGFLERLFSRAGG